MRFFLQCISGFYYFLIAPLSTLYRPDSEYTINSDYDSDSESDDIDSLAVVNHDIKRVQSQFLRDECVSNEANIRKPLTLEIPSNLFVEFTSDSRKSHG